MNRILIVEDEPAISNLIQMNLAARDTAVTVPLTGLRRPTGWIRRDLI